MARKNSISMTLMPLDRLDAISLELGVVYAHLRSLDLATAEGGVHDLGLEPLEIILGECVERVRKAKEMLNRAAKVQRPAGSLAAA